jgi:hypothetical protein
MRKHEIEIQMASRGRRRVEDSWQDYKGGDASFNGGRGPFTLTV